MGTRRLQRIINAGRCQFCYSIGSPTYGKKTEKLQADHQVQKAYLAQHVKTASSLRPLETAPDKNYGFVYAFDLTPCDYPLHCLAWIKAHTPGVFFRCYSHQVKDEARRQRVRDCIEPINFDLPAGSFAISPEGEVLYKKALYYESMPLSREIVNGLLAPSFEFIGPHWQSVLHAVFGTQGNPHHHS